MGAGGKFLLMIIFLSLISNNIINTYSAAFGVQLAGTMFAKVPRWLWAILLTAIYLICALVGRNEFSTILGNFTHDWLLGINVFHHVIRRKYYFQN